MIEPLHITLKSETKIFILNCLCLFTFHTSMWHSLIFCLYQYICHLLILQIKKPVKHPYFPNQKGSKALILRTQGQGTSRYRKSGWISFSYVTCATNSAVTIKKFLSFVCTFHKRNRKEPWIESHPSSTLPQTPFTSRSIVYSIRYP